MKRFLQFGVVLGCVAGMCVGASAQVEGPVATQALVNVDHRSVAPAGAAAVMVAVNGRKESLTDWQRMEPAGAQVALLFDDGLRSSVGRELDSVRTFIQKLPAGVEVMVGFMQNGRVVPSQEFTADHGLAASSLHLPTGLPGTSGSPYLCLSDFVKHWPGGMGSSGGAAGSAGQRKARFVLMITDGVDLYNGDTSPMNQDSPYVAAAVSDAQRAGVAVYAIYFADAGIRGSSANNSGQNYLAQVAGATGGVSFWQGMGNPVSMAPFLDQFREALSETYIATFPVAAGRDLVRVKFSADKAKLRAAEEVRPGNQE